MDRDKFQKQIDFILEIDKEKEIYRQTHLRGYSRQENDAEHAWHMAVMIYLLKEYANEEFDVARAMIMALIHDIVEIDAGDTYAYDTKRLKTQAEREEKAADRIFGILPCEQKKEMLELLREFNEWETPEAKFAHTMDNFQPLLLNDSNNGKDWRIHGIKRSQVIERQRKSELGSKNIWKYTKKLIDDNAIKGNLIDE